MENRCIFVNTFIIEHYFPNQILIWRQIFNTEIKFAVGDDDDSDDSSFSNDGSLNVMKDGHHYQLLNLVDQHPDQK